MKVFTFSILKLVMRGYGQMFLANNITSGMIFFIALLILSPANATWSLLGAVASTLLAKFAGMKAEMESGLFGINGALLGLSWMIFPEVPAIGKLILTLLGSLIITLLLVVSIKLFKRMRLGLTLFALPYIFAVWLNVFIASAAGWYEPIDMGGWNALAMRKPDNAKILFEESRPKSIRGRWYQHDGLGWANYYLGHYQSALKEFQKSIELEPKLFDAYSGVGWCEFNLGHYEQAELLFKVASNWNGLGWIHLGKGEFQEARSYFYKCLLFTPLNSDAYLGISRIALQTEPTNHSAWLTKISYWIQRTISPVMQTTSSIQILSWTLFLMGILWHSRTSFFIALFLITTLISLTLTVPSLGKSLYDINLFFNLLALFLAFGGQYLRMGLKTALWTAVLAIGMVTTWEWLGSIFNLVGLPVLCLPFNLALVATLIVFPWFHLTRAMLIPLEVATSSPEEVNLWLAKAELVGKCWKTLEKLVEINKSGLQP